MSWPDHGYFTGEEVLACEPLGVTPHVPKPLTSGSKAAGRFGKQDFVYIPDEDAYRCPADQRLTWCFTSAEKGMTLHSYWTSKCAECPLKTQCTTGKERRIKRREHEAVIDAMQDRLTGTRVTFTRSSAPKERSNTSPLATKEILLEPI
jgi:hypothetical protein